MTRAGFTGSRPRTQPLAHRVGKLLGEATAFAGYVTNMRSTSRLLLPHGRRVTADVTRLYQAVAEQTDATTLVDASKDPGHFLYLDQLSGLDVQPILLIRDGRAVVWSKIRRTGIDPRKAIDHWARITRMQLALSHRRCQSRPAVFHYEAICRSPTRTLDKLFAGGRPTTSGGDFQPGDRHHIGGAPDFRLGAADAPRLDLRWVDEMPDEILALFERKVGGLNARLGYGSRRLPALADRTDQADGGIAHEPTWPMASLGSQ